MGCDIHLYVEYKSKNTDYWRSFGKRINPGRIYGMFAKLADVRNGYGYETIAAERGLPDNISYEARNDSQLFISETDGDDYVHPNTAKRWVESGSSVYTNEGRSVTHPDWHSHSWATTQELEEAFNYVFNKDGMLKGDFIEYAAIISAMKEFEKHGYPARVVFWFDN